MVSQKTYLRYFFLFFLWRLKIQKNINVFETLEPRLTFLFFRSFWREGAFSMESETQLVAFLVANSEPSLALSLSLPFFLSLSLVGYISQIHPPSLQLSLSLFVSLSLSLDICLSVFLTFSLLSPSLYISPFSSLSLLVSLSLNITLILALSFSLSTYYSLSSSFHFSLALSISVQFVFLSLPLSLYSQTCSHCSLIFSLSHLSSVFFVHSLFLSSRSCLSLSLSHAFSLLLRHHVFVTRLLSYGRTLFL